MSNRVGRGQMLKEHLGEGYGAVLNARFLLDNFVELTYDFVAEDVYHDLLRNSVEVGMRVYWRELLLRAHMASYAGLKRVLDWIDIIEASGQNYVMYCSGMRGLIECCGDTYDGLSVVAVSFSENHLLIKEALAGKATKLVISTELENQIIHFTHASKAYSKTTKRKEHAPKESKKYVQLLNEQSEHDYYEYYQYLCEVVHPASTSLGYNFEKKSDGLCFSPKRDASIVSSEILRDSKLVEELLMRGLNPIFLLAKTINLFKQEDIRVNGADKIGLSNIKAWARVENNFNSVK